MNKKLFYSCAAVFLLLLSLPGLVVAAPIVTWPGNTISVDFPPTNIIVADDGTSYVTNNNGGIMKYLPDGTLDTSWGVSGKAIGDLRPIFLCFDENGDVLTGSADGAPGVIRISADTGADEIIIENMLILGIAVDNSGNIYINNGNKLLKYSSNLELVWEKLLPDKMAEMGLCILPDGSFITTNEQEGSVQKYTSSGDADTSFGTNGVLDISDANIGFASYDDALYVSCYGDGVINKVSLDGQNVEPVLTGASPTILVAKDDFYFIPNWLDNSIDCFEKPNIDIENEQFSYTVTPTILAPGSADMVTLDISSESTAEYEVTANVYNKASNELITDITATTAFLVDGDASIVITPSSNGWPAGEYYIEIVFTDYVGAITVSDSLRIDTNIMAADQYVVTFESNGGTAVDARMLVEGSLIAEPEVPAREGYTFTGWYSDEAFETEWDFETDTIPAENITLYARWGKSSSRIVSGDVQTTAEGLAGAVDVSEDLDSGQDVDVILELELRTEDKDAVKRKLIDEPLGDEVDVFYLDISLYKILKSEGAEDRQRITDANNPITITITIPEDQRGSSDYKIMRVHNGVAEYLDTQYDPDNHTLTFTTDRFSTYSIVYVPTEETGNELPRTISLKRLFMGLSGIVLVLVGVILFYCAGSKMLTRV